MTATQAASAPEPAAASVAETAAVSTPSLDASTSGVSSLQAKLLAKKSKKKNLVKVVMPPPKIEPETVVATPAASLATEPLATAAAPLTP